MQGGHGDAIARGHAAVQINPADAVKNPDRSALTRGDPAKEGEIRYGCRRPTGVLYRKFPPGRIFLSLKEDKDAAQHHTVEQQTMSYKDIIKGHENCALII